MNRKDRLDYLVSHLAQERGDAEKTPADYREKRRLLRSLMNLRPPAPLDEEFLREQDAFLQEELAEKEIIEGESLSPVQIHPAISLWRGDITTLRADAIVNAANSKLLGCFQPCHSCIDNVIHSAAGLQLRRDCHAIMEAQGHDEPTGAAKITPAYNLPSRYVLHTVGPIIGGPLTEEDRRLLGDCYRACFDLAAENGLASLAFCCISTGVFHFPQDEAAEIALSTVLQRLEGQTSIKRVIFNVFTARDYDIYRELLG